MEMGYADWVVAKYLANYSIRWIAEQTGTAQAMVKATLSCWVSTWPTSSMRASTSWQQRRTSNEQD